jgi:hypothetical protein
MTGALVFGGSASAATTIGSKCAGNTAKADVTVVALKNPAGYPLPSAIPSAGVITSWSLSLEGVTAPEVTLEDTLKVFEPTGAPNQFRVAGESQPQRVAVGVTTSPTRIPVKGGDLLGNSLFASAAGESVTATFYCRTEDAGDEAAFFAGDPGVGALASTFGQEAKLQNPITVTVEPDTDGDGYGDETQDKCTTDPSAHGVCPPPLIPPVAPITLGASAAAKKGLVIVTLTASAQANVTISGTAKLGKGKTATLVAGTQVVAPGTLAKVPVLFPAKLKKALKQLPTSKKVTLSLSASAPGATTTSLTVRVPGQKKPAKKHRAR